MDEETLKLMSTTW